MAKVNLKNFVDINIKKHISSAIIGTRETTVLFTPEGTNGSYIEATSYSDLVSKVSGWSTSTRTLAYGKVYFDEGGVKLRVIEGTSYSNITSTMISDLDNEFICIAYASNDSDRAAAYSALKGIAKTRATDDEIYGINEKLIIVGIKLDDHETSSESPLLINDTEEVKNFIVKASSTIGAEMSIPAYLSKVDVYGIDTVYDYNFTKESLLPEDITEAVFTTLSSNNINVDIELAQDSINCGGNCKDGSDLINEFVRIVLHQTLTNSLVELLVQKLKSVDGLSKIYTTIVQELNNYLKCGYLTTDKIWKDNDLKVSYNGQTFTIIEKGTALTNGYLITILPFNSLSDTDKAAHKTPPIYVIIADQYGIRKITINGEVI